MLEVAGSFRKLLEVSECFRRVKKGTGGCKRLQKVAESCRRFQEIEGGCRRLLDVARGCRRLQKVAGDCKRLQEVTSDEICGLLCSLNDLHSCGIGRLLPSIRDFENRFTVCLIISSITRGQHQQQQCLLCHRMIGP